MPKIASKRLALSDIPPTDASVDALIEFAHTFDAYRFWGSVERCAEIANAHDHSSIDKIRTCLFFEARSWHFCGEDPDDEALEYWRSLVAAIRHQIQRSDSESIAWFIGAIRRLSSDERVPDRTPGYNKYNTQRDHWLGWLDPTAGTGTYPRKTSKDRDARDVYNRIVEPRMLLWLISAAGVRPELLQAARQAAEGAPSLAGKSAAIRRHVPWPVVADALLKAPGSNVA